MFTHQLWSKCYIVPFLLAASAGATAVLHAAPVAKPGATATQELPFPRDFSGRPLVYKFASGYESWPAEKRRGVVAAMDEAVTLYNAMGEFPKNVTASYNPGTPTADGSYNGNIRFGGSLNTRVALHELGHVMGVGTHPKWWGMIQDKKWTGPHAIAQLKAFDGPDAVLNVDGMHFWPYGLNYDNESSPENDRRHVLIVAAFRRDLGIVSGKPIRGMVGVGTWATHAEFKDIKVTKGNQTLFTSDFSKGLEGWKTTRGQWQVVDGALRQASDETGTRALIGDPSWTDYTLTLKARKLSGKEGFLILFGSQGDDEKTWWNLGGWDNTQHGLEIPDGAAPQVEGSIETGRWYDIRIEVQGSQVKAYLDGKLVQQGVR